MNSSIRDITVKTMSDRIERQQNQIRKLEEKIIEAVHYLEAAAYFKEADKVYSVLKEKY